MMRAAALATGAAPPPATPYNISTRPPSRAHTASAMAIAVACFGVFLAALATRHVLLPRQDAFVPIVDMIICINDLITAGLLYAQFSVTGHRALVMLASGFLLKALVLILHTLAFPGVFGPMGLLGGHLQTAAWLYLAQHWGFFAGVMAYSVLRSRPPADPVEDAEVTGPILASASGVIVFVAAFTWFVTANASRLPSLMADPVHLSVTWRGVMGPSLGALGFIALVILTRRWSTVIDLWLKVAVWSWLLETVLVALLPARYSLLFYVGRSMGTLSSSFLLIAFLAESLVLQRRLALAMITRERERVGQRTAMEVTVGSLAHELRQPLAAMRTNAYSGGVLLSSGRDVGDDLREIFDDLSASVDRADAIIHSVRTMFAGGSGERILIDANELVREAVETLHLDLEAYHVETHIDFAPDLPPIHGHRGQLMQVLLNGIKNAVESLADVSHRARELRIRTARAGKRVSIVIEDSGPGIGGHTCDRAFEPFYSTKPFGMGLGLSICGSIVGAHGGTVLLVPGEERGAVFRVDLPARVGADETPAQTMADRGESGAWSARWAPLSRA
jgi:signal transduction histidine kinase